MSTNHRTGAPRRSAPECLVRAHLRLDVEERRANDEPRRVERQCQVRCRRSRRLLEWATGGVRLRLEQPTQRQADRRHTTQRPHPSFETSSEPRRARPREPRSKRERESLSRLQLLRPDGRLDPCGELLLCPSSTPPHPHAFRPRSVARSTRSNALGSDRGLAEKMRAARLDAFSTANPGDRPAGNRPVEGSVDRASPFGAVRRGGRHAAHAPRLGSRGGTDRHRSTRHRSPPSIPSERSVGGRCYRTPLSPRPIDRATPHGSVLRSLRLARACSALAFGIGSCNRARPPGSIVRTKGLHCSEPDAHSVFEIVVAPSRRHSAKHHNPEMVHPSDLDDGRFAGPGHASLPRDPICLPSAPTDRWLKGLLQRGPRGHAEEPFAASSVETRCSATRPSLHAGGEHAFVSLQPREFAEFSKLPMADPTMSAGLTAPALPTPREEVDVITDAASPRAPSTTCAHRGPRLHVLTQLLRPRRPRLAGHVRMDPAAAQPPAPGQLAASAQDADAAA